MQLTICALYCALFCSVQLFHGHFRLVVCRNVKRNFQYDHSKMRTSRTFSPIWLTQEEQRSFCKIKWKKIALNRKGFVWMYCVATSNNINKANLFFDKWNGVIRSFCTMCIYAKKKLFKRIDWKTLSRRGKMNELIRKELRGNRHARKYTIFLWLLNENAVCFGYIRIAWARPVRRGSFLVRTRSSESKWKTSAIV